MYSTNNTSGSEEPYITARSLGLSVNGIPCPELCPPDLLALAEEALLAEDDYYIEHQKINELVNGPDRQDIPPDEIVYMHNVRLSEAEAYREAQYRSNHAKREVSNYIENCIRDTQGIPRIGEGWVNEMRLYRIVESLFPNDKVHHLYRAKWLGRLELDVYVEGANIAFEYQGIQHFEPQEHWGGVDAFKRGQKRDAEKAKRCKAHGTPLIEVTYMEQVTVETVQKKLERIGEAENVQSVPAESQPAPNRKKRSKIEKRPKIKDINLIDPIFQSFVLDKSLFEAGKYSDLHPHSLFWCAVKTKEEEQDPEWLIDVFDTVLSRGASDYISAKACRYKGELLLSSGDKQGALDSFRLAVEFDQNVGVKRLIKQLEKELQSNTQP